MNVLYTNNYGIYVSIAQEGIHDKCDTRLLSEYWPMKESPATLLLKNNNGRTATYNFLTQRGLYLSYHLITGRMQPKVNLML